MRLIFWETPREAHGTNERASEPPVYRANIQIAFSRLRSPYPFVIFLPLRREKKSFQAFPNTSTRNNNSEARNRHWLLREVWKHVTQAMAQILLPFANSRFRASTRPPRDARFSFSILHTRNKFDTTGAAQSKFALASLYSVVAKSDPTRFYDLVARYSRTDIWQMATRNFGILGGEHRSTRFVSITALFFRRKSFL